MASGKTNLIEPLRFLLMALFAVREVKWKNFLCLFSDADMFENTYRFLIGNAEIEYTIRYQNTDKLLVERLALDGQVMMERTAQRLNQKSRKRKSLTGFRTKGFSCAICGLILGSADMRFCRSGLIFCGHPNMSIWKLG